VPNYPDPADALIGWLVTNLPAGPGEALRRIVPELPLDLFRTGNAGSLPCAVVSRYGGFDDVPGLDDCAIDVDVFSLGTDPMQARTAALGRAEDIRHAIRTRLPGQQIGVGGPVVSRVRVISAPCIRPYDSLGQVRRAHAAYQVRFHSAL
jgi:hypothetical protein